MKLLNKSHEPEFQVLKQMESAFTKSYDAMLLNMNKVLITETSKKLKQNARSTK